MILYLTFFRIKRLELPSQVNYCNQFSHYCFFFSLHATTGQKRKVVHESWSFLLSVGGGRYRTIYACHGMLHRYFSLTLDNQSVKRSDPHSKVLRPKDRCLAFLFCNIPQCFACVAARLQQGEETCVLPSSSLIPAYTDSLSLFLHLAYHFDLFINSVSTHRAYTSAQFTWEHVSELHKKKFVPTRYVVELFVQTAFCIGSIEQPQVLSPLFLFCCLPLSSLAAR